MRKRFIAKILVVMIVSSSVISGCGAVKAAESKKPKEKVEVSKVKDKNDAEKLDTQKKEAKENQAASVKEESNKEENIAVSSNDIVDTGYVVANNTNSESSSTTVYSNSSGSETLSEEKVSVQQTESVPEVKPEPVWIDEVGHMEQGKLIEDAWDEEIYEIRTICFNCGADITGNAENHACPDGSTHHGYGTDRVLMDVIHHPAIYGDPYWVVDIPGHYE